MAEVLRVRRVVAGAGVVGLAVVVGFVGGR